MYYLLSKIPPRFKLKVNAIEFNLQVYIIFSLQFFIHSTIDLTGSVSLFILVNLSSLK